MGFSLSQGPYQYNRFDDYEKQIGISEGEGASSPAKMAKAVEKSAKKTEKESAKNKRIDSKEKKAAAFRRQDQWEKNRHDAKLAETVVLASDKTASPAENLARRAMNKAPQDTKAKLQAKVMEDTTYQMDSYVRALGRMGATYDIHESKKEHEEDLKDDEEKDSKYAEKDAEEADYDKKKGKSKRAKELDDDAEQDDADKGEDKKIAKDVAEGITKEMVVDFLVNENYASNGVSAEVLHQHMSDEFLVVIENMIAEAGYNPKHPYETEQQAEAQKDRRAGKQNREGNKVANKKGPIPDTEGSNTAN